MARADQGVIAMTTLRLGATKRSIPALAKAGAAVALLGLAGCDQIPSEFHGKWYCDRASGTYEIGSNFIAYTTRHSGRALSTGNWRGDVASVKDAGGGTKYIMLKNSPMGSVGLEMVGNRIQIDSAPCTRTY